MQIIPVIDLKQGQVVHGIGGRRGEYQPIVSRLAASATPGDVARGFVEQLDLRTAYVADLDAISGAQADVGSYRQIAHAGMRMWIDAGTNSAASARSILEQPQVDAVIVGLESLDTFASLQEIVQLCSPQRVIFSLDLKGGAPLTGVASWRGRAPMALACAAIQHGISRMIVLDLAAVGSAAGPQTLPLLRELRDAFPSLELMGGGGVRDQEDLAHFAAAGCHGVLVASALHSGRLRPPCA